MKYPHKLYKEVVEKIGENDYGQAIYGEPKLVFVSMCDHQVNSNGIEIRGKKGIAFKFSSQIFIPEGIEIIPTGTIIEIREQDDTLRERGEVSRPGGKDNKGSRLWV